MFEYYLKRLIEVDKGEEIRKYLKKEGFENLHKLLLEYAEKKNKNHDSYSKEKQGSRRFRAREQRTATSISLCLRHPQA